MTRLFGQTFQCPQCGHRATLETQFSRWVRGHNLLESREGLVVLDQDMWVHRFKTDLGRCFQCLMLVEVKVLGANLTDAQRDTLHIINQVTRNRRATPTKPLRYQAGNSPQKVHSVIYGSEALLKAWGVHVLRFSGLGPQDSEWISWDNKPIDRETLVGLLRFDLDPDTLKPFDARKHHRAITLPHRQLVFPTAMHRGEPT